MKILLLGSVAALALGGCAAQSGAPVVVADVAPVAAEPVEASAIPVPDNILLADWKGPYAGVPPWDQIKPELFDEAYAFAIAELEREAAASANNPAAPTFENTILAMEKSGARLEQVGSIFGVMTDNMSSPEYQALDKKWSPKLSAAYDKITLDPKIFARVETLYNQRDSLGLDAKQLRVLTRTYDGFVRRGAKLTPEQKTQVSAINQELASAFSDFNSKLLADEGDRKSTRLNSSHSTLSRMPSSA